MQKIHMECQDLIFLKYMKKKIKMSSVTVVNGTLRIQTEKKTLKKFFHTTALH